MKKNICKHIFAVCVDSCRLLVLNSRLLYFCVRYPVQAPTDNTIEKNIISEEFTKILLCIKSVEG